MPPITPFTMSAFKPAIRTAALDVLAGAALELAEDALPEVLELVVAAALVTTVVSVVFDALVLPVVEAEWLEASVFVVVAVVALWPVAVEFPAVVVLLPEAVDERLSTLKPRRSLEASLEKTSVAMPVESPEQALLVKRSILIPCSPWESILNR